MESIEYLARLTPQRFYTVMMFIIYSIISKDFISVAITSSLTGRVSKMRDHQTLLALMIAWS